MKVKREERRVKSYFLSQSRRVYWAAELLHLRIRERRETFGLEGSSQRCTNTVFAVYLLNLNISSTSPNSPKFSLLSPHKAEGPSAVSASHTYHLCGSINSAALREKSDNQAPARKIRRFRVTRHNDFPLKTKPIKPFVPVSRTQVLCPLWGEGMWEAKPLPALIPQRADPPPSDLGTDTKENLKNRLAQKELRVRSWELGVVIVRSKEALHRKTFTEMCPVWLQPFNG